MNLVLVLLVSVVVLAVAKAVLIPLATALLLVLAYAFISRPRDTLLLLGALAAVGMASARPATFIIVLGILGVGVVAAGVVSRPGGRLLLTDSGKDRST